MAWNDFSENIDDMLSKDGFAFNPKKRVHTKQYGDSLACVDIAKEDVYIFGGDGGNTYNDLDGILAGIRDQIVGIVGSQVVDTKEPPVESDTDEYIKTADELQTDEQTKISNEALAPVAPPNVSAALEPVKASSHIIKSDVPPDLSIENIKKYINDKVTDEEAYVFLQLCLARNLNPFTGEVYLIKYDHLKPATMVVGKDAFMKRAEVHPQYDGFEAGIITDKTEFKVGTFINIDEKLLGGWAKVYRKDHSHPVVTTVSMTEYSTGKALWDKKPATMIRKVALVQALRESFPNELSGMYDSSEVGVDQ